MEKEIILPCELGSITVSPPSMGLLFRPAPIRSLAQAEIYSHHHIQSKIGPRRLRFNSLMNKP